MKLGVVLLRSASKELSNDVLKVIFDANHIFAKNHTPPEAIIHGFSWFGSKVNLQQNEHLLNVLFLWSCAIYSKNVISITKQFRKSFENCFHADHNGTIYSGLHISFTSCQQGQNPDMVHRSVLWYAEMYCEVYCHTLRCTVIYWGILPYTEVYWGVLSCTEANEYHLVSLKEDWLMGVRYFCH